MALIDLKGVCKSFVMGKETIRALDHVSFDIKQGEFVAIVGPSGSGKSTLMNILGLLDKPDEGSFLLEGRETSSLSDDERAQMRNQKIGFVFQSFNLLARASAQRNVEMPLVYASSYDKSYGPEKMHALATEALTKVGLADRLDHRPNELSGGQRQRVAIARALVNHPRILFADEPTGNLDSKSGEDILKLFHDLNKEGTTIVMVTHDPKLAARLPRAITVFDGKVKESKNALA